MRAGRLRHRIGIQTNTPAATTTSAAGTDSWVSAATIWASVSPLRGREREAAQKVSADVSHKVVFRTDAASVTTAQRVLFGTRTFDINAVLDRDERGIETTLWCTERK